MGQDLEILPVLNKIDLPGADADKVAGEVEDVIGLDCSEAIAASAKQGIGIEVSPWSGSQAIRGGQAQSMTSAPALPPSFRPSSRRLSRRCLRRQTRATCRCARSW